MLIFVFKEWSPSSGRLALANGADSFKVKGLITEIAKRASCSPYRLISQANIYLNFILNNNSSFCDWCGYVFIFSQVGLVFGVIFIYVNNIC